jgi:hypothetical protein
MNILKEIQMNTDRVDFLEQKGIDIDYSEKRRLSYPDFAEYLDGVVKNNQEQIDKYIEDCRAVKAKYPK